MAQPEDATLQKIRQYAIRARELHGDQMDVDADASSTEGRLEQTIQELQTQVERQKSILERVILS